MSSRRIPIDPKTRSASGLLRLGLFLGLVAAPCISAVAQNPFDKIYSFTGTGQVNNGIPYNFVDGFYDAPLVLGTGVNTNLWFISQKGGLDDGGELLKFSLATNTLTVLNQSYGGTSPPTFTNDPAASESSPVYDNGDGTKNYLYLTSVTGGVTGRGTLFRYNMDTNTSEILWSAPSTADSGLSAPRGAVTVVDRGIDGKDVYFTASGGGAAPSTSAGGILRYNTKTGITKIVVDFTGAPSANFPYDGFVRVGSKLYFTTFAGGNAVSTGSGTLGYIDISDLDNPTYQLLAALPGTAANGAGSATRLPGSTPIYDSATNSLYFTTVGSNSAPGSIQKFNIGTGVLSTLYTLADSNPADPAGPNSEGRQGGYNSPYLYNGYLYMVTRLGGANNLGVVSRYNLALGVYEVLYNLTAANGGGLGDFAFSDFDWDGDGNPDPALYFLGSGSSTTDGIGSILRLSVPEPGSALLCLFGAVVAMSARRRKALRS